MINESRTFKGETVIAQHNVKKILFCAKGDGAESTCIGFTTHYQVATDDQKDIFRCQVFYFSDAGSTEHSLQCLAQAFGNIKASTGSGRSTGDAMTYLFDFQVIVREGEIAKGSMQGCPTAKSVFKLRVSENYSASSVTHLKVVEKDGRCGGWGTIVRRETWRCRFIQGHGEHLMSVVSRDGAVLVFFVAHIC